MKHNARLRAITATGVSVGLAMTLTACGSSTPGQPASSESGGNGASTTIEFWHRTFTPVENEWYANIVKEFNESQSEIFVKDTQIPADTWDQKLKAAQAAGNAPDVYTHSGSIQDAVNAGQLYELDEIMPAGELDEIVDAALPVSEVDGKHYTYPLLLEPQAALFWNSEVFEKAGLDPERGPETWDDLLADCEKIKPVLEDGQYCIAPAQDATTFAWATVGQQYNFQGHVALTDDWAAPNLDNPEFRELMNYYKQLWDNGYMPKQLLNPYVEGREFGEGKVAFKVSGSWLFSELASDYSDMLPLTRVGKFPSAPNARADTTTTLGNFTWVVDANTDNAEAAGKFISWAIAGDPENLVPFFVDTQFTKVPVRKSVQEAVASADEAADAPWQEIIANEIAPGAIPEPTYPWDISLAVGTAMESVMTGAADADDAISAANTSIQTVIDREKLPERARD